MLASELRAESVRHVPVVVIGAGQAGLSVSYYLKSHRVEHLVLEQHAAGYSWRERRWDSFCLVTPNWQCELPGFAYAREFGGRDPEGFMTKPEILAYLDAYLKTLDPPLIEGVRVERLRRDDRGGFWLRTSTGELSADQVVVAVGGYHVPKRPELAARLPEDIVQLHAADYRNPESLPAGAVIVVGSGQSGCQIAEDLHLAGRKVHLCVGSAPRVARRYRGRDVVAWLDLMGYYDLPVQRHPLKEGVRARANHYVTGRDGGRDIDLRAFALQGMELHGRLCDVRGTTLCFGDDLANNLDAADATSENIKRSIDEYIARAGIEAPIEPPYLPLWQPGEPARQLDLAAAGIRSVIWAMGYRADFSWIELPVFDGKGYPSHERGVTPLPGLYFIGLPWLYTWGSGRFCGIARDARYLVDRVLELRAGTQYLVEARASARERSDAPQP